VTVAPPPAVDAEVERASAELPGFHVMVRFNGWFVARDPSWQVSGIAIEAGDADELIERVRSWVRFLARIPDLDGVVRAGRLAPGPGIMEARSRALDPTELAGPKPDAAGVRETVRAQGYSGEACGACGSMRTRWKGKCLGCDDCGQSGGCS
jgi:hypothetical protein